MGKVTRALGTTIAKGTVPELIGGLTSIGGIEITADTMDVTTLDSEGGYRESIGTFKDAGEVPIEGFFDHTSEGQMAMQESMDVGTAEDYTITFPTTPVTTWKFKGIVTSFKVGEAELDGAIPLNKWCQTRRCFRYYRLCYTNRYNRDKPQIHSKEI
jgi:predicted secreted protein